MDGYIDIISSIRAVANGLPPQKNITKLLQRHGCTYLNLKCMPPAAANSYICLNKLAIREKYNACAPVFDFLNKNGIKFAVMKGAILSQVAYGNFAIRKSTDIDLFVNRSDVDRIRSFIINLGFVQGRVTSKGVTPFNRSELIFYASQSHQIAPFIKKVSPSLIKYVNLDVNTNLLWGECAKQFDTDFALSHLVDTTICNTPIKKFALEIEFIALCLHHYKDMNSIWLLYNGSLKLSLFSDIYFYIINNKINFSQVKEICDKCKIRGAIYYCLYYTNEVFGGLESYLKLFFDIDAHNNINKFGLAEDEIKEWGCSFYSRLFRNDFKDYFCRLLSEKDMLKIKLNRLHI